MRIIILILFSFSIITFAQEGWIERTPSGSLPGLYGVYAIDKDNIWVVGEQGTILHSKDAGSNWINSPIVTRDNLIRTEFINPDTGWVIVGSSSDSSIFRTTNGGSSWQFQPLWSVAPNEYLTLDIDFVAGAEGEPMWGYVTGGLGQVWRTVNYGDNWENIRGDCGNGNFWSSCFCDKNTGWFVGTSSTTNPCTILNMTDGGSAWLEQANPTDQPLREVSFADPQRGVAVGLVGTILYTADGGQNWESRPNNGYRWQSVFLTESGKAWAVGDKGRIAFSNDWGYTWVPQESGVDAELWEVFFINDNEGWIVGGGIGKPGVILHTTNGGITSSSDPDHDILPDQFVLSQNRPNPFNPFTTIEFTLPRPEYTILKIYNILGAEVATLVSDQMTAGQHRYTFDGTNVASGVYYYRVTAGEFTDVKKMILLR